MSSKWRNEARNVLNTWTKLETKFKTPERVQISKPII